MILKYSFTHVNTPRKSGHFIGWSQGVLNTQAQVFTLLHYLISNYRVPMCLVDEGTLLCCAIYSV